VNFLIQALVPGAFLLLVAQRLTQYRTRPTTRPFSNMLLLFVASGALQVEALAYGLLDPRIHAVTGAWNISALTSWLLLTAGWCKAVALLLEVDGRTLSAAKQVAITATLWTLLVVTFMTSHAPEIPTPTEPIHVTGALAAFWFVILATTAATPAVFLVYLRRVLPLVERGPVRHALLALVCACVSLILWCLHKVAFITLDNLSVSNWYTEHTVIFSRALIALPGLFLAAVAAIYARNEFPERFRRYSRIRALTDRWHATTPASNAVLETSLIPQNRRAAWRASRTPLAAHRMMVEILDASAADGGRHDISALTTHS